MTQGLGKYTAEAVWSLRSASCIAVTIGLADDFIVATRLSITIKATVCRLTASLDAESGLMEISPRPEDIKLAKSDLHVAYKVIKAGSN